jgi:hypothetical protein
MTRLRQGNRFHWAFTVSLVAALAVISPFFFLGQASGHDFQFHVASWLDVAQQWHAGVVFPRWAALANFGYGEPRFIFYPPLSWCLGAALGSVLPWSAVPATFIFLCLVFAGVSMFRLASAWLSPAGAVAAAVLYVVNPYQLVVVYIRSDFAELIAASLLPLALHFVLRCAGFDGEKPTVGVRGSWRNVVPLAICYGAIWLANAPAAVIASYALGFLLVLCAVFRRSFWPLETGLAGLVLGLMLAAFYVLPAAHEQAWVNINQAISAGFRPAENFLFTWGLDPEHNLVNLEISAVAILMITLTGIGATISHRRNRSVRFIWIALFALAAVSVLLMFPLSGAVWQYAPKLRFLQFPWRWMLVLGVSFAFFAAETIVTSRHRVAVALVCAVLLAGTGVGIASASYWDSDDLSDVVTAVSSGRGYQGTDEYCTLGADQTELPLKAPLVALLPGDSPRKPGTLRASPEPDGWSMETWRPDRKVFLVDVSAPTKATVRLLNYPAWQVRVNGVRAQSESGPISGQMIVAVPEGKSHVEIRFGRTRDRTLGGTLSGIAVLVLACLAAGSRRGDRAKQAQLSGGLRLRDERRGLPPYR